MIEHFWRVRRLPRYKPTGTFDKAVCALFRKLGYTLPFTSGEGVCGCASWNRVQEYSAYHSDLFLVMMLHDVACWFAGYYCAELRRFSHKQVRLCLMQVFLKCQQCFLPLS